MQTSVGYPDFLVISKNSQHKAAAMVVSNLLLEPEMNARVTEVTGNAYNLDLNKLVTDAVARYPAGRQAGYHRCQPVLHHRFLGCISAHKCHWRAEL
ncbi:MAG: hypothetical protein LBC35_05220 [Coriobacteriales bacterium]|jgi:ABC-type uncharacterized transport system YnjBCD substrate-binding protein|nr:hypothetical protein [Coriobacteriales bacterium]